MAVIHTFEGVAFWVPITPGPDFPTIKIRPLGVWMAVPIDPGPHARAFSVGEIARGARNGQVARASIAGTGPDRSRATMVKASADTL